MNQKIRREIKQKIVLVKAFTANTCASKERAVSSYFLFPADLTLTYIYWGPICHGTLTGPNKKQRNEKKWTLQLWNVCGPVTPTPAYLHTFKDKNIYWFDRKYEAMDYLIEHFFLYSL